MVILVRQRVLIQLIYLSTKLSPEVAINDLNKALADGDHMKAKLMLCDMIWLSKLQCNKTGSSSTIAKVVNILIKNKNENPGEMIRYSQVYKVKKGNTVITYITPTMLTQNQFK